MIGKNKLIGIAAVAQNGVIGKGNSLPWHLPEDLAWFKRTTMGHVLVMGRETHRSIGRFLPGRKTYILTRTPVSPGEVSTLSDIESDSGLVFLCGGSEVYSCFLTECDELVITHVKIDAVGDKFFPLFDDNFRLVETILSTPKYDIARYARKNK